MNGNTYTDFFARLAEKDKQKIRQILSLVLDQNSAESYFIEVNDGQNRAIAVNLALRAIEPAGPKERISVLVKNGITNEYMLMCDWEKSNEDIITTIRG